MNMKNRITKRRLKIYKKKFNSYLKKQETLIDT